MMIPHRVLQMIKAVAWDHGVSVAEILGNGRRARICAARRDAMRAVRWMDFGDGRQPSYPQIGRWFGRDHTTVIHACQGYEPPVEEQLELGLAA
jgi:chromosomal replication initiator protein